MSSRGNKKKDIDFLTNEILYYFTYKFTHRCNADMYLKISDNPDLSGEINE